MQFSIVLTVVCFAISGSAHNILVFLPNKIWSHYFQVEPIFHALANRGHNLTIVSPFPPKNKNPNIRHFPLEMIDFDEIIPNTNWMEHSFERWHAIFSISLWKKMADARIPKLLESSVFQDLYNDDNKFDLIFTELFFGQEALVVLGHIFNAPVVTYSSYGYDTEIFRYSGAMNAVAYLPWKDSSYPTVHPSSLLERLDNALISFAVMLFNEYWYFPDHDALLAKHLPGPLPRITDMLRNVSLFILTANTAVDGAKLFPPNVIEISGIHMKEPEPLDKDLNTIINNAKDGVIYFSFGSILKASALREQVIDMYMSVFKELKQTILWKADSLNSSSYDLPKNVYTRDWFDQKSVLAHPNCVLFLTHGGVSSLMEAIHYAVPIVGMSFFGDQPSNLAHAEHFGYGLHIPFRDLTQDSLRSAIRAVLEDKRFKENISKASKVFNDKPMSSLDTAIYWIEYVIRHEGAHHLKPLTVQMPWYQLFLLDVIVVYLAMFIILSYFIMKIIVALLKKCILRSKSLKEKTV
nr:PREDICTED: UDP-glucuronosyltransferase 2B7-like isoform X4 [Bemisia tabaci]